MIDITIEELSSEREPEEAPSRLTGNTRAALDHAFRHGRVEPIFEDLETFSTSEDASVRQWATETLAALRVRSPTSLKVALKAIRKGNQLGVRKALQMELRISTAYCVSYSSPEASLIILTTEF